MKPHEIAQIVLFVSQYVRANRNKKSYTVVAKFKRMVEIELFGEVRHAFRHQITDIIAKTMQVNRIKQVNRFRKGKGRVCWKGFASPDLPNLPISKRIPKAVTNG